MKIHLSLAALVVMLLLGAGCAQALGSKTKLSLLGTGLTSLPSYVLEETQLEWLDISNNQITGSLPAEIRQLENLRVLDASDNLMTGVPAEIGQLSQLEELDLSNNQLTGLPNELGNLKNLLILDLTGNEVSLQDVKGIEAKLPNTEIFYDK
jgi:Leucine-rich repeat (LRR) protein